MTLTLNYKCEHCGKEECDALYFDKLRKEWHCKVCSAYFKKNEEVKYTMKERNTSTRGSFSPSSPI